MKNKIFYKWELIILLWVAFFLNQGDRQVFNVVIPLIKQDLHLSDVQIGLVVTIFTILYGILVPFAGYVGDVVRKSKIIVLSLAIFSLGTLFTGLSNALIYLILFRSIATGGGEAFYYPSANALIGEYHQKTRAQAMSIHQTALYVGIVASGFLAGYIGEELGWRAAFYVFGGFGVLWVILLVFRLKESGVVRPKMERIPLTEVWHYVKQKPTLFWLSAGFAGFQFVLLGYLTWMPTFLHSKFGLSLSGSGFHSVFYHHLLAFIGVLLGGRLSDRWAVKRYRTRMRVEYISLLLGVPFVFLIGFANNLILVYVALAGFGLFRGVYDSNLFAALYDVIDPKYRTSATGLMLSIAFIASSLSPILLGWINENAGLSFGFTVLSLVYLLAGIMVFTGLRASFKNDFLNNNVRK